MFIKNLLNLIIIDLFKKIENGQLVENLFPEKMIHDLSESYIFLIFGKKRYKKKHLKIKFVKYITFLCSKFVYRK